MSWDDAPPSADEIKRSQSSGSWDAAPPSADEVPVEQPRGLIRKGWDALAVPEQMSREGLTQMAGMVSQPEPTGNVAMDLIKGAPRIAADTIAQAAPGFISRGSLVTAGASKVLQAARPIGSLIGRGIAGEAESATGAVPGSLKAAWNDPTLIFSKGKKAASPLYEAGKAELEQGANIFKGMFKPDKIVEAGQQYLDKGGKLEPAEGLIFRKALDILGKSKNVVKDEIFGMREGADAAAKASDNIAAGDATFQRGLNAESLRRLVPQNKYGGSSAFKMALMTALGKMGGPAAAGLLSPAVHGIAATLGGLAARVATNPAAAVTARRALITQFVDQRRQDQ